MAGSQPLFVVGGFNVLGLQSVSPFQLADVMRAGGIVLPRIGWYGESSPGSGMFTRNGGHIVTMWGASNTCGDPADMVLGFGDPWAGDSTVVQSDFVSTNTQFNRSTSWRFRYSGEDDFVARPLYQLEQNGGFLDGMRFILPAFGMTTNPVTQDIGFTIPQGTTDEPGPKQFVIRPWPADTRLVAMAPGLPPTEGFVLTVPPTSGVGTLQKVHFLDGDTETVDTIPRPIDLVVGRDGSAYVATTRSIMRYEVGEDGIAMTSSVALPNSPDSMIYDDEADELLVLSVSGRRLFRLGRSLDIRRNDAIPAAASLVGNSSITINPIDGAEWIASSGSRTLTQFGRDASSGRLLIESQPTLPGVGEPEAVQFDDFGVVHLVDDGVVRAFVQDPDAGWVEADTPLNGVPSGPVFRIGRGRTNGTPINDDIDRVPPAIIEGEPDCRADLDVNGMLNIFDFLEFQNLFVAGSTWADFDFDGQLTLFDILAFQNEFDAGCP